MRTRTKAAITWQVANKLDELVGRPIGSRGEKPCNRNQVIEWLADAKLRAIGVDPASIPVEKPARTAGAA